MNRKPWHAIAAIVLCLAPAGCADAEKAVQDTPAAARHQPPLTANEETALQNAMDRFVAALKASDTQAFATLFPRHGLWTFQSSIGEASDRSLHSLADLRRDLTARNGLYESFFEGDGDSVRDFVETTGGRAWQRTSGPQFSPPDLSDLRDLMFVRWRREDGRWVVDTVAAPFA
jgi:hypothetical protein